MDEQLGARMWEASPRLGEASPRLERKARESFLEETAPKMSDKGLVPWTSFQRL